MPFDTFSYTVGTVLGLPVVLTQVESKLVGIEFLACLNEVQEELLFYPRHRRWRWRRR